MQRVVLIHWRPEEAQSTLEILRKGRFDVQLGGKDGREALRSIRTGQPAAVVIDLSRLPSHGREIATDLRRSPKTRSIPIIFLGGLQEKVEATRTTFPDAGYCDAASLVNVVNHSIKNRPDAPVQPLPMMDRYKGRSVAQKLGIVGGVKVGLLNPPRDYEHVLGPLPDGVELEEENAKGCSVVLWFIREQHEVDSRIRSMARHATSAKLWVVWPKGQSAKTGAATENTVRDAGLAAGLVDYKVCSVSEKWSGLLFARAKE